MDKLRIRQFPDVLELQAFLQGPVIGDDKTKIVQIYFDSNTANHVLVYYGAQEDNND